LQSSRGETFEAPGNAQSNDAIANRNAQRRRPHGEGWHRVAPDEDRRCPRQL